MYFKRNGLKNMSRQDASFASRFRIKLMVQWLS